MQMQWLKLYNEARVDRKLAVLSLAERGVWVNLLCYANEQQVRGTLDIRDRMSLALECADGDEATLNSALDKLLRIRHLVPVSDGAAEGCVEFRTFAQRQARPPSANPDATRVRQQKSRAERKASSHEVSRVTRGVSRGVTANVTKKRNVTSLDKELREREDTRDSTVSLDGEVTPLFFAVADADGPASQASEPPEHTLQAVASNGHVPSRQRRPDADPPKKPAAPPKPSSVNPIWDALVAAFGYAPESKDERSKWGMVVRDLKALKATPEEVARRCQNHRDAAVHWTLTPRALVTHWGELGALAPAPLARASPLVEQAQRLPGRSAPAFRPASELSPWAAVDAQRAAVAAKEAG